jgi:hypothetical protein
MISTPMKLKLKRLLHPLKWFSSKTIGGAVVPNPEQRAKLDKLYTPGDHNEGHPRS